MIWIYNMNRKINIFSYTLIIIIALLPILSHANTTTNEKQNNDLFIHKLFISGGMLSSGEIVKENNTNMGFIYNLSYEYDFLKFDLGGIYGFSDFDNLDSKIQLYYLRGNYIFLSDSICSLYLGLGIGYTKINYLFIHDRYSYISLPLVLGIETYRNSSFGIIFEVMANLPLTRTFDRYDSSGLASYHKSIIISSISISFSFIDLK